jgi:ribose transport system ATP-binding protein
MGEPLVRMTGIEKRFPGVLALSDCRFELNAGEVHALVGENGAGKSTLMKILTGVYRKDAGSIVYKGRETDIPHTKAAQQLGIGIIHQELNLIPDLTVAQNLFIGREPRKWFGLLLDDKELERRTLHWLEQLNVNVDPKTKVADLTVAKQQMIEIVKALSYHSEVLIMDEPTAALTDAEIRELFRVIGRLKSSGVGIVYISHRMEELKVIADRITVMRDGRYVDTVPAADAPIERIIAMMVGRELEERTKIGSGPGAGETVLEVKGLSRGSAVKDVSFRLRKGEILGIAGLMGAGRTEVARAIFGADRPDAGEIVVRGRKARIRHPHDAVRLGIGYLSEDRKRYGLLIDMDVCDNIAMASLPRFRRRTGWMRDKAMERAAEEQAGALRIKTPGIRQKVKFLSGGNQQKVVIGKWLVRDCDILIFDEPTRGIDVGAKAEIYALLEELAARGKSIVMISSELPEILRLSHRILVMCEGRMTGELSGAEATQENIMKLATQRGA